MSVISGLNAPTHIVNYIQRASDETGVDFSYLVHQAKAESSFDPNAKARTSSATGLFQFIERTWLDLAEKHGHKYGLEGLSKQELLDKRKDPEIASMMAAELATENKAVLEARTNEDIGATELYFAHFLGAGKASDFINARAENGDAKAAYLFPKAAKANQAVFFNRDGSARTLDEVHAYFDKKFNYDLGDMKTQLAAANQSKASASPNLNEATPLGKQDLSNARATSSYYQVRNSSPLFINPSKLDGFDADVQEMVLSPIMMELQTIQNLRSDDLMAQVNRSLLSQETVFSLFSS